MKAALRHTAVLVLVNLLAHFLPFERAMGRSHDDLAFYVTLLGLNGMSIPAFLIKEMAVPDRPLQVCVYLLQLIVGRHDVMVVTMVFLTSSLLTCAVYLLLRQLLEHPSLAFLGALVYLVLPNKLELYHTLDYANQNMVYTVYVASFFLFIIFTNTARARWLWCSLCAYTIAIFWYELGFFLPFALGAYTWWFRRKAVPYVGWFFLPALAYALWRLDAFGLLEHSYTARPIMWRSVISNLFTMLPQHYVGRFMAKSLLYGWYRFPTIEQPWLTVIALADTAGLIALTRWIKPATLPGVPVKIVGYALFSAFVLVVPATFYWGILARHTALASIGVAVLVVAVLSAPRTPLRLLLVALVGLSTMACQGAAWSQVVACRINQAILYTLTEQRDDIRREECVLIDQYSFATHIPYTWVRDPHNQLDTYWGAAALLGRGFPFLVELAVGGNKPVYVVRSAIELRDGQLRFKVYNGATYQLEEQVVPSHGTILIDYEQVYGKTGFPWK